MQPCGVIVLDAFEDVAKDVRVGQLVKVAVLQLPIRRDDARLA